MGLFQNIGSWIGGVFRKRRVSLFDNNEERWFAELSPARFTAICIALTTLIFGVLLLLVAYTPILDILPGYRTNAGRSREMLIRSIVRIDSLERKMNEMLIYNENRILVVGGKTPTMRTIQNDSLSRNKQLVLPSQADSLLREQMEKDKQYRIAGNKTSKATSALNTTSPMYGIISDRFNGKNTLGVRLTGAKDAHVMSIAEGVVVSSEWSAESKYTIIIQHKNDFISVYRNIAGSLAKRGDQVRSSQVIGYACADDASELSQLDFELWHEGKAVNPELYIIF